jgi:hypothetical protein
LDVRQPAIACKPARWVPLSGRVAPSRGAPRRAPGAAEPYIPLLEASERGALHEFVRQHHVHYEVEPEEIAEGGRRELVGVRLRLLATHERGRLDAPGCPACVDLLRELGAFADRVVGDAGIAERAETIPATRKLYQSSEDRNADEVALTIRVHCDRPEHRRPGAAEDRCIGAVRERLAEVGVART